MIDRNRSRGYILLFDPTIPFIKEKRTFIRNGELRVLNDNYYVRYGFFILDVFP